MKDTIEEILGKILLCFLGISGISVIILLIIGLIKIIFFDWGVCK